MTFSATIYIVGINPCVDVPEWVSGTLQKKPGFIPVKGTVNVHKFIGNLVPVKHKPYRLYLNLQMRQGAKADVGDVVTVTLENDFSTRVLPMPRALAQTFKLYPEAKEIWKGLPPSRQKEVKLYVSRLKSDEAIERNIDKLLNKWGIG